MKLIENLNRCRYLRKEYRIKPTFRFYIDTRHYYFSFLPTVLWMPWIYRHPNGDGVVDIWWLNLHLLFGTWELKEV